MVNESTSYEVRNFSAIVNQNIRTILQKLAETNFLSIRFDDEEE